MNLKKIDISLILLSIFAVVLHIFSGNSNWVEYHYSSGLFLTFSNLRCLLFGELGFSFGDILYGLAFLSLIFYFIRFLIVLFQRKIKAIVFLASLKRISLTILMVYLMFNIFWGLNYNRLGIASQIGLDLKKYDNNEYMKKILINKINNLPKILEETNFVYEQKKKQNTLITKEQEVFINLFLSNNHYYYLPNQ